MGEIIDCKYLAEISLNQTKGIVNRMKRKPVLTVFQIGHDPASDSYIRGKKKDAEFCGIHFRHEQRDEFVERRALHDDILNACQNSDGVMVQLPIPERLESMPKLISWEKDVDCLRAVNLGKVVSNEYSIAPCTAEAVIYILERKGVHIDGANAVVVGRSNIVGKPTAMMLTHRNATVTLCHSHTKDLAEHTRRADILVVAAGHPGLITADMVKEGATVIDVGINRDVSGKIVGDVDTGNVLDKVRYVTPVPGGVGLLTRAMLMKNVVEAAARARR